MPYDPENPPDFLSKLPEKKQRQWVHVFNSAIDSGADEDSAFAQAWGVANKAFDYKVLDLNARELAPAAVLNKLLDDYGAEGYGVVALTGNRLILEREYPMSPAFPIASSLGPVARSAWSRKKIDDPDKDCHWDLRANEAAGEKRVEVVTSQDSGVKSGVHSHRAVIILDLELKVLRGLTSDVGHFHVIKDFGSTSEEDGHTHIYDSINAHRPGTVPFGDGSGSK